MATIIKFPVLRVEHDTCPKCGNLNGPFERRGEICNGCLDKRVKRRVKK